MFYFLIQKRKLQTRQHPKVERLQCLVTCRTLLHVCATVSDASSNLSGEVGVEETTPPGDDSNEDGNGGNEVCLRHA